MAASASFSEVSIDFSTDLLVNEARVTRNGGATVIVSSATQPVGVRSKSVSVECQTDTQAAAIAALILTRYATPLRRVVRLVVKPRSSTTAQTSVISDVLGSRVETQFAPVGGGADIDQTALLDQIAHQIGAADWTVTYALNSAEAL